MKSTRRGSFSVHRSKKNPRFQIQLDKRPLSPGTSREAGGYFVSSDLITVNLITQTCILCSSQILPEIQGLGIGRYSHVSWETEVLPEEGRLDAGDHVLRTAELGV